MRGSRRIFLVVHVADVPITSWTASHHKHNVNSLWHHHGQHEDNIYIGRPELIQSTRLVSWRHTCRRGSIYIRVVVGTGDYIENRRSYAFLERINQSQMDTNPCWFPRMEAELNYHNTLPPPHVLSLSYASCVQCHTAPNPRGSTPTPPSSLVYSLLSFSVQLSALHSLSLSLSQSTDTSSTTTHIEKLSLLLLLTCAYITE